MKKSFVELLNEGIIEQVEKREAAVVQGGGVEPNGGDWPNLQNCDSSLNQHIAYINLLARALAKFYTFQDATMHKSQNMHYTK